MPWLQKQSPTAWTQLNKPSLVVVRKFLIRTWECFLSIQPQHLFLGKLIGCSSPISQHLLKDDLILKEIALMSASNFLDLFLSRVVGLNFLELPVNGRAAVSTYLEDNCWDKAVERCSDTKPQVLSWYKLVYPFHSQQAFIHFLRVVLLILNITLVWAMQMFLVLA